LPRLAGKVATQDLEHLREKAKLLGVGVVSKERRDSRTILHP
jgi:hypothetical protein